MRGTTQTSGMNEMMTQFTPPFSDRSIVLFESTGTNLVTAQPRWKQWAFLISIKDENLPHQTTE
jgi:hypothetical protein